MMEQELAAIRASGVTVIEEGDWRNRKRPGLYGPIHGIINHHTAIAGNAISTLINGRPDLAGPLCNIGLDRLGRAHMISAGRANHAGLGSGAVLGNVISGQPPGVTGPDNTDGNRYFYGIEVENNGIGESYSDVQITALIKINAAICRVNAWNENHVIHHKEWTKRKIDMSWAGDLRGFVRAALYTPPSPPVTIGDEMAVVKRLRLDVGTDGAGNGYAFLKGPGAYNGHQTDVPVPWDKFRAVHGQGSYIPAGDGYGPTPKFGVVPWDGFTFIEINEGQVPSQPIFVDYVE